MAGHHVKVAVTDPAGHHLNTHLARARVLHLDLAYLEFPTHLEKNRGS
jgi:hypothetical protein